MFFSQPNEEKNQEYMSKTRGPSHFRKEKGKKTK